MVVSCERSPHSARKVRVKAWMKMGEMKLCHFLWGRVVPDPASTSGVPLASLDRWSYTDNKSHGEFLEALNVTLYLHFEIWEYFCNCNWVKHNTNSSHEPHRTISGFTFYFRFNEVWLVIWIFLMYVNCFNSCTVQFQVSTRYRDESTYSR